MFVKVKGVYVERDLQINKEAVHVDTYINMTAIISLSQYYLSRQADQWIVILTPSNGLVIDKPAMQIIEAAMAVCNDAVKAQTMGLMQYRAEMREMQISMYKAKIELEQWKRTAQADADAHCMLALNVKAGVASPLLVEYTDAYAEYRQAFLHHEWIEHWLKGSPSFEEVAAWQSLKLPTKEVLQKRVENAAIACNQAKIAWENEDEGRHKERAEKHWQEHFSKQGQQDKA